MIELDSILSDGVPAGWTVKPFWALFRRIKRTGYPDAELLSVYRDHGVVPKSSRDDNFNKESEDLSGYQLVQEGALVTNKMKAWQGSIAISRYRGIVSPAYYVYEPQSREHDQFLHYLLRSEPYIALYQRISKGIRVNQWDLEHEALRGVPVPLPPRPTQKAIADLLDRETARIDLLIEKKQRLLELLQQKNEVESLALVVGQEHDERRLGKLDWASSLPLHWEERAVWMIFALGRGRVISHEDIAQSPGPYPIYSSQTANDGVLGHIDTFDFEGDYLTWTTDGAKAGTVFRRSGRFNCTNVCGTLRPLDSRLDLAYFRFALDRASGFFVRHDINPKLMNGVMAKIRVPFPPYEEQKAIGGRLTAQQERLTPVREKVAASIGRLREFRAALITAAVTGQIDPETWSRRGATDRCLDQIEAEMSA